ncbi:GGDEF domain-containing protein [Aquabacterium sp.]|uniref:sensor domain-containing diguanylate cyclase n=1 Tax=Aquabacterium sp. TaxID=1872578 RepID=UPI0037834EF3
MSDDPSGQHRPITEDRLLAMVNASGDAFWETDAQRRFVHLSDNMCRTMGYPREELLGRSVLEFMTPEYKAEIVRMAAQRATPENPLTHTAPLRHEGEFFRKDGSRVWIETVSVPVFDDDRQHLGYFGITRDVTERKRSEQALSEANRRLEEQLSQIQLLNARLHEQSIRDDLTGLHNRRHFVQQAEQALREARDRGAALSLVLMDIDHFKAVNDQHGHPTGDAALKAVGSMLAATVTPGQLAARLGGEEFAVLLPDTSQASALAQAEQWRATLANMTICADGAVLRLTALFGVASAPAQADALVALLKLADTRLYHAKALGRDRVVGA